MPKRKLQKIKTSYNIRTYPASRSRAVRDVRGRRGLRTRAAVFAALFLTLGGPAGWLVANAQTPDDGLPHVSGTLFDERRPAGVGSSAVRQDSAKADDTAGRSASAAGKPGSAVAGQVAGASSGAAAAPKPPAPAKAAPAVPVKPAAAGLHQNIITTIFWAGEAADASNDYISNAPSAWDERWAEHFGGYDDPDKRTGYHPAAFTPRENPFYFALPYSDYDAQGNRRATAGQCSAVSGVSSPHTSWCKNAWIKIIKGSRVAYAQWQDVGPLQTDDTAYVFGNARPQNTWGAKAGLDVSPAVRDYLGLSGIDTTSWAFVPASDVPAGPWRNIVTTSGLFWE